MLSVFHFYPIGAPAGAVGTIAALGHSGQGRFSFSARAAGLAALCWAEVMALGANASKCRMVRRTDRDKRQDNFLSPGHKYRGSPRAQNQAGLRKGTDQRQLLRTLQLNRSQIGSFAGAQSSPPAGSPADQPPTTIGSSHRRRRSATSIKLCAIFTTAEEIHRVPDHPRVSQLSILIRICGQLSRPR
jgi:hypothetical protein